MKPGKVFFMAVLALALFGSRANATENIDLRKIIRVIGTPRPEFTVEVSQEDLKRLAETLSSLPKLDSSEIDINDLYRPGDEVAIGNASKAIAGTIIEAAKELVNLKVIIYRFAALSSVAELDAYEASLYKAYQDKIKTSYEKLIRGLVVTSDEVREAIVGCKSELCVSSIASAQTELLRFGDGLNRGLRLKALYKMHFKFTFQNKFLKGIVTASVEALWDNMVPPNTDSNPYGVLLAGALTPIVAATAGVVDVAQAVAQIITSPSVERLRIKVKPLKHDFDTEVGYLKDLVARKLYSLVNGVEFSYGNATPVPRHVFVLTCSQPEFGDFQYPHDDATGHAVVAGPAYFSCHYSDPNGRMWPYMAKFFGFGPGLGVVAGGNFVVTIWSLMNITPEGAWYGLNVDAVAVVGLDLGVFVGKNGSIVTIAGVQVGMIAAAAAGQITISRTR